MAWLDKGPLWLCVEDMPRSHWPYCTRCRCQWSAIAGGQKINGRVANWILGWLHKCETTNEREHRNMAKKTVPVKIAVAVLADGSYIAEGWDRPGTDHEKKQIEDMLLDTACSSLDAPPEKFEVCWVTAEVPLPDEEYPTVQGSVDDDSDPTEDFPNTPKRIRERIREIEDEPTGEGLANDLVDEPVFLYGGVMGKRQRKE
jgi:hypothetical protein